MYIYNYDNKNHDNKDIYKGKVFFKITPTKKIIIFHNKEHCISLIILQVYSG